MDRMRCNNFTHIREIVIIVFKTYTDYFLVNIDMPQESSLMVTYNSVPLLICEYNENWDRLNSLRNYNYENLNFISPYEIKRRKVKYSNSNSIRFLFDRPDRHRNSLIVTYISLFLSYSDLSISDFIRLVDLSIIPYNFIYWEFNSYCRVNDRPVASTLNFCSTNIFATFRNDFVKLYHLFKFTSFTYNFNVFIEKYVFKIFSLLQFPYDLTHQIKQFYLDNFELCLDLYLETYEIKIIVCIIIIVWTFIIDCNLNFQNVTSKYCFDGLHEQFIFDLFQHDNCPTVFQLKQKKVDLATLRKVYSSQLEGKLILKRTFSMYNKKFNQNLKLRSKLPPNVKKFFWTFQDENFQIVKKFLKNQNVYFERLIMMLAYFSNVQFHEIHLTLNNFIHTTEKI
ncbi:hypothetical protein A3Q56_07829 [Intoshia linei]|uniref:Uncharacterized protein n=1 Tax=Intoshia linei TaxID=1819745 RepID=A0A177ASW4_9BILA|nr:hypothetical protein A3Q56_07829 [Intoshia linei]